MTQAEGLQALQGAAAAPTRNRAPRRSNLGGWLMTYAKRNPLATARDTAYLLLALVSVGGVLLVVGEYRAEHRRHGCDIAALQQEHTETRDALARLATSMAELAAVVKGHAESATKLEAKVDRLQERVR